jgi:uncharacterized protein with HEPN domain
MRDYKLYLKDILEAMEKIEEFVKDMDLEAFKNDDKTQSAVIRKFEIIGEATKNISQEIKDKYNSIPWKEMAGMRDKLIHFYFGINCNLIWRTIKENIPYLKSQIKKILEEL